MALCQHDGPPSFLWGVNMRFARDWTSHVDYSLPAILKWHNFICMSSNSLILAACSFPLQYYCYQNCCLPIQRLQSPDISCFEKRGSTIWIALIDVPPGKHISRCSIVCTELASPTFSKAHCSDIEAQITVLIDITQWYHEPTRGLPYGSPDLYLILSQMLSNTILRS